MWETYGRGEITYEAYIDQYITAEIPTRPDDRDHSLHAVRQREYHDFIVNHMYHTCSVGVTGCKETADDKCSKGFPVILPIFARYMFVFLCRKIGPTRFAMLPTEQLFTEGVDHHKKTKCLIPLFMGTHLQSRQEEICVNKFVTTALLYHTTSFWSANTERSMHSYSRFHPIYSF